MWVEQRIGPFRAGKAIEFPVLINKDSNFGFTYVRIGIQAPQAPIVTETRTINYNQYQKEEEKLSPIIASPTRTVNNYDIDNTHCFSNGIKIEDTTGVDNMHIFKVGRSSSGTEIRMNAGEVIEFTDMNFPEYFKVTPMQNEDAYTIIEIQYFDDPT